MSKYKSNNVRQKYGQGWFLESQRHSLARQGIKTGRKSNLSSLGLTNYVKELPIIKFANLFERKFGKARKVFKINKNILAIDVNGREYLIFNSINDAYKLVIERKIIIWTSDYKKGKISDKDLKLVKKAAKDKAIQHGPLFELSSDNDKFIKLGGKYIIKRAKGYEEFIKTKKR